MNREQYMDYDMKKSDGDISGPIKQRYHLISPLSVDVPRKKGARKIYLNLNSYRNLHYIVNNQAKTIYKELMESQIKELPLLDKVSMTFILHKSSNRKIDRHNICSVVQKYFCDALVELGKMKDDDDRFIESETYKTGTIEKNNGYCEIIIETV